MKTYKLDLHNLKLTGFSLEEELKRKLDSFFSPLLPMPSCKVELVVGRGVNTNPKNFINGQNPLKFYTKKYLQKMDLSFTEGDMLNYNDGVLVVWW